MNDYRNLPTTLLHNQVREKLDVEPDAMEIYNWLAQRGVVQVSNGDGDSIDVFFIPFVPRPIGECQTASVSLDDPTEVLTALAITALEALS